MKSRKFGILRLLLSQAALCLALFIILGPLSRAAEMFPGKPPFAGLLPVKPSPSPTPTPSKGEMPGMQMPGMQMPASSPAPSPPMDQRGMSGMSSQDMGPLLVMKGGDMAVRVGETDNLLYCGQMGSGTSWTPHSSPLQMWDKIKGGWLVMFHFNAFIGVNSQGGPRGETKFESANWFMPMAFHKLGKGTLQLRGMFSAEPFTYPPGGSPLLFQTGETYKGRPLIDHQHPHDLFMELSAQYTRPLGERGTWFAYLGYPGEPALGPDAFMHRSSASENPSAPLAHHLQDSTHISFGVFTTGFTYRWFKLEGSVFNGREPDENRYNFDAHKWNSRSARLSFSPNHNWSTQISYGFLRSPENQEPNADVERTTASLEYNRPMKAGNLAMGFIWGRNHVHNATTINHLNGYTFESTLNFLDKNYLYTRLELVDRDDLLSASDRLRLGIPQAQPSFRIGAYTFGAARNLWANNKVALALGADVTFYSKPASLDVIYGDRPVSWKLFARIRPAKMKLTSGSTQGSHSH